MMKLYSVHGLVKKAVRDQLPHGRGWVNTWKHAAAILSHAREQVVPILRGCFRQHEVGMQPAPRYVDFLAIGRDARRFSREVTD